MIDIVIIGGGMSGSACARALRAEGLIVRLIDKGRGIGGRIATRWASVTGNYFKCQTKGGAPSVFK